MKNKYGKRRDKQTGSTALIVLEQTGAVYFEKETGRTFTVDPQELNQDKESEITEKLQDGTIEKIGDIQYIATETDPTKAVTAIVYKERKF